MSEFKETSCSCPKCVKMCEHRPCWPTAEEASRLIDADYGPRMMNDYWVGGGGEDNDSDIQIISPAKFGYEGKYAPFWPTGRCSLLTDEGKCPLHDLGLKPLEARVADCKSKTDDQDVRKFIVGTWNTEVGRAVVKKWEEIVVEIEEV